MTPIRLCFVVRVLAAVIFCCAQASAASAPPITVDFSSGVLPLLNKYCVECHGPDKQKSDVRLDTLSPDLLANKRAGETWRDVRAVINLGEMPPEDETQLTADDRAIILNWLNQSIDYAAKVRRSKGGRIVLRRLNRVEYQNTLRDLLGLDLNFVQDFPPDAVSIDGLTNNGSSLQMTPIQMEFYLQAARKALDKTIISSPQPKVFHHTFQKSTDGNWVRIKPSSQLGPEKEFIARIKNDYPDHGKFRVRVKARAEKPVEGNAIPLLQVYVGYRPDTLVDRELLAEVDVHGEGTREYEFSGWLENFPMPVRGQGKYPGLVVSIVNGHQSHLAPRKESTTDGDGKKKTIEVAIPDYPYLHIESVTFEGPVFEQWPPAHHTRILPHSDIQDSHPADYMRQVLVDFLPRAWRRPVTDAEVERLVSFFSEIQPEMDSFLDAARETLALVLISPHFLFLLEPSDTQPRLLDNFELASRLAYFLWSSLPDEHLLSSASSGGLSDPKILMSEVDRMMSDPRIRDFIHQFTSQWLDLDAMDRIEFDKSRFKNLHPELMKDIKQEPLAYFEFLLRNNLSASNMLASDFVVLNDNLSRHYGLEHVPGDEFRQVHLTGSGLQQRGGLLTQSALLMGASNGKESNLVKRAVLIRDRILGDPPPPPPPNVPDLESTDPDFASLPQRRQLEIHRSDPACNDCHKSIDPWGQPLEQFNALGLWKSQSHQSKGDERVDASAVLPDGHQVDGIADLKSYLVTNQSHQFARGLVSRMLTYALGRSLEFSDDPEIDRLTAEFLQNNMKLKDLVHSITSSILFQSK